MVPADRTLKSICTLQEEGNLSDLQPEYPTEQPSNPSGLDPLMIAGTEAERQCGKQFNQGSQSYRHRLKSFTVQHRTFGLPPSKLHFLVMLG